MPSLFKTKSSTRSRNFSSPAPNVDELGRVVDRGNGTTTPTPTKSKSTKKKKGRLDEPEEPVIPDGTFVGFNMGSESALASNQSLNTYSFLAPYPTCTLSLQQLAMLVDVVCGELGTRGGITTPFVFSSHAVGLENTKLTRLIRVFVEECINGRLGKPGSKWLDEARFAEPYELGMCLRWGLARIGRTKHGQIVKGAGLVDWDWYINLREGEQASSFQPAFFAHSLPPLDPTVRTILLTLLSLLTRLTANSASSGHTPPTLAALFGVLVFGCPAGDFEGAYAGYILATNALEHVLLAFIRWQDAAPGGMGVPTRLKEWIRNYEATATKLAREASKPQARKGARTVRVQAVKRNVQSYSEDLVRGSVGWGKVGTPTPTTLSTSAIWDRIISASAGEARFSESFQKKMNLASDRVDGSTLLRSSSSSTTGSTNSLATLSTDRFGSLADLKWGEFESLGFGESVGQKLEFDLTESMRKERTVKRSTLSWNDFSSDGFSRSDAPLSATLQFSPSLSSSSNSPTLMTPDKKLRKQPKAHDFDMTPVMGQEMVIEESFVDVFCELVCGSRWEEFSSDQRDCNWALVEYRCLAPERTALMLFEEYIPSRPVKERTRLASLFSTSNASTVGIGSTPSISLPSTPRKNIGLTMPRKNGVGLAAIRTDSPSRIHAPSPSTGRGSDFEGLLSGDGTKFVSLSGDSPVLDDKKLPAPEQLQSTPSKRRGLPTVLTPNRRESRVPAEYSAVDFRPTEREDAWVDILVESNARKMDRQVYNPDQASVDVQKALEGVHLDEDQDDGRHDDEVEVQHVPNRQYHKQETTDFEDEPEPYQPDESMLSDGEEDYPASQISRADDSMADYGDDDGESDVLASIRKRRAQMASYFDAHPDRRPLSVGTDDQSMDDNTPKHSYDDERPTPTATPGREGDKEEEDIIIPIHDASQADGNVSGAGKGKTAALIEMYREKEKGSPVRALPTPPSPPIAPEGVPARELTPGLERYVHGAPLHNVLEEEEEN